MTWTVFLFDFRGEQPQKEWLDDKGFHPPPMGSLFEVKEKISRVWPDVQWDHGWNIDNYLERGDCCIKITMHANEDGQVDCLDFELGYTEGQNPYPPVVELCQAYGWSVYDTETATFWEMPDPPREGLRLVRARAKSIAEMWQKRKERNQKDSGFH